MNLTKAEERPAERVSIPAVDAMVMLIGQTATEPFAMGGAAWEAFANDLRDDRLEGEPADTILGELLPKLADGGRIVNLSSGLARFAFPGYAAYGCMKAAVEAFTRYLAKELGERRITANVVAPGPVETDMNRERFEDSPQMVEMLSGLTALGRIGRPDDVGGVIAFLCSEDAGWVTGQRIELSGGMLL